MSEVKVNKISPRTACGTVTLGDSGDTFTVPSGATISNLGTATGFGGTGVVSWETSSIKTTGFTAVTGTGYFCNTTGGEFTVTLPLSPSAGDVVGVSDYAKTFDTDKVTLGRNGSNIGGEALDGRLETEGIAITLVYVDGTKGWIVTDSGNQSDAPTGTYIAATGGCITTCGNFKIHTFTGPGTFCVSAVGNPAGSTTVDYLVIGSGAGGGQSVHTGSAGTQGGGGGGAGGYRESSGAASGCYTIGLPAVNCAVAALPVSATPGAYPITAVAGGAGGTGATCSPGNAGTAGGNSTFSTITSNGGGSGSSIDTAGSPGASGGGAGSGGSPVAGGTGNTPPTTPAQGFAGGGNTGACYHAGGGGGASAVGGAGGGGSPGNGEGGVGATSSIASTCGAAGTGRGGGGGGGPHGSNTCHGTATCGGGAAGVPGGGAGSAGTVNTGGGGGGSSIKGGTGPGQNTGGNGGSGVVIIRYKYQ